MCGIHNISRIIFAVCCLAVLTACEDAGDVATLGQSNEGLPQDITVNSTPQGASCNLSRNGQVIGTVQVTPASVSVEETDADITVSCTAPGYAGSAVLQAGVVASAMLNTDVYPDSVTVTLTPGAGTPIAAPSAAAPASFGGVGMVLKEENSVPIVVTLLANGPAARAGVQPGDAIAGVDGLDTWNLTLPEVAAAARGVPGTQVSLTVWRKGQGEPLRFTLTRETVTMPPQILGPASNSGGAGPTK